MVICDNSLSVLQRRGVSEIRYDSRRIDDFFRAYWADKTAIH